MPFTFAEYLQARDPLLFGEVLTDLGVKLGDKKTDQAFVAALQKQKVDLKKATADTLTNPDSEPDETQLAADQQFKQQDMLAGKVAPDGIKKDQWDKAVGTFVPDGQPAVPNLIGKGKPFDIIGTLEKGAAQGALPQGVEKYAPPGMKMKKITPKVNTTTPEIDPKQLSPSQLAKSKSMPKAKAGDQTAMI